VIGHHLAKKLLIDGNPAGTHISDVSLGRLLVGRVDTGHQHPHRPELRQTVAGLVAHRQIEVAGQFVQRRVESGRLRTARIGQVFGKQEVDECVHGRHHCLPLARWHRHLAWEPVKECITKIGRMPPAQYAVTGLPAVFDQRLDHERIDRSSLPSRHLPKAATSRSRAG
jgi:hypothetical protein